MQITSYGLSDIGRVRARNEDACLLDEKHSVFAVADGLGGLPYGARASRTAVSILKEKLTANWNPLHLKPLLQSMNREILTLGRRVNPDTGIGTTMTAAAISGERLDIAHVGDSAVYRFTPDRVEQLTIDHTLEQEIRSRPDFNPRIPIPRRHSHVLTRCLGQIEDIEIDAYTYTVASGDRILLCTDGVTLAIKPDEIHAWILEAGSPETIVRNLIRTANERGGHDNATAIAVFIDRGTITAASTSGTPAPG